MYHCRSPSQAIQYNMLTRILDLHGAAQRHETQKVPRRIATTARRDQTGIHGACTATHLQPPTAYWLGPSILYIMNRHALLVVRIYLLPLIVVNRCFVAFTVTMLLDNKRRQVKSPLQASITAAFPLSELIALGACMCVHPSLHCHASCCRRVL
jgi:hypothetical protein